MDLSHEDSLRLHVLIRSVEAIRIDEQSLTVCGLSTRGEARVTLTPNCRPALYLKRVREFISGAVLGSPGGYPVFLQRWTRMGQARDTNLAELLMLGEPEAVTAVAGAPGLTDDLARRAWWAAPTADIARRMLAREAVARGGMGPVLAEYLVEHLPFETEAALIIESVRLILQPGLIASETSRKLWERGAQKGVYRIGFLQTVPEDLPDPRAARADLERHRAALESLAGAGNTLAGALIRALDRSGQSFAAAAVALLERLTDQNAAVVLLNSIGEYYRAFRLEESTGCEFDALRRRAAETLHGSPSAELAALRRAVPELERELVALLTLAGVTDALATAILAQTTASGTLLRRKLEPVCAPLCAELNGLLGAARG